VRKATVEEVARYKPQSKRELKEPVFTVQAGDIALLVEYDMQANAIPFVGQLGVAYQPPVAAPRAAPVPPPAPVATRTQAEARRREGAAAAGGGSAQAERPVRGDAGDVGAGSCQLPRCAGRHRARAVRAAATACTGGGEAAGEGSAAAATARRAAARGAMRSEAGHD